jgi:hypothetical protein
MTIQNKDQLRGAMLQLITIYNDNVKGIEEGKNLIFTIQEHWKRGARLVGFQIEFHWGEKEKSDPVNWPINADLRDLELLVNRILDQVTDYKHKDISEFK